MQTIEEESQKSSEEFKSQLNTERNVSYDGFQSNIILQQNSTDAKPDDCQSTGFAKKCILLSESSDKQIEKNVKKEINFNFTEQLIDFKDQTIFEDIFTDSLDRQMSPMSAIEEFRGTDENNWQLFHRTTSTPNTTRDVFPDLNISTISFEENDSDFLCERPISPFQITDQMVSSSSVFEDVMEPNE